MWNFLYLFQPKIYLRAGFNDTSQTYQKLLLWLFICVELGLVEYSFPIAHCSSNNSVKFKDSAFCCHLLTNSLTFNELRKETCTCKELHTLRKNNFTAVVFENQEFKMVWLKKELFLVSFFIRRDSLCNWKPFQSCLFLRTF